MVVIRNNKLDIIKDFEEEKQRSCAIVNPVNCVGVMGAGMAKDMKEKYPSNYETYKDLCNTKNLHPGKLSLLVTADKKLIINAATKDHWKDKSKIEWIIEILDGIQYVNNLIGLKHIYMPALGCGLGGLKVADVLTEVKKVFDNLDVVVYFYCDKGAENV